MATRPVLNRMAALKASGVLLGVIAFFLLCIWLGPVFVAGFFIVGGVSLVLFLVWNALYYSFGGGK